jgi:hypothetical protein
MVHAASWLAVGCCSFLACLPILQLCGSLLLLGCQLALQQLLVFCVFGFWLFVWLPGWVGMGAPCCLLATL